MHEICLFGTTRVVDLTGGSAPLTDFGGVKPRQLLELLALAHGEALDKAVLADRLWEGRPPSTCTATLESHLSVLRRHLIAWGTGRDVLTTVNGGYRLSASISVDLTRVSAVLATAAYGDEEEPVARLEQHLASPYRLLQSSPHASWSTRAQEHLDARLAEACRRAAQRAVDQGRPWRAATLLHRALEIAPLSDVTEQMLLLALAAAGARADALASFADFRARLRDELGVEPDAATRRAYLQVLSSGQEQEVRWDEQERTILRRLLDQVPVSSAAHHHVHPISA